MRDHLLQHVDAVDAARRDRRRKTEAGVHPAGPEQLVDGVPAGAGQVRVGTPVEQVVGQLPVGVGHGHHQRALTVRQRVVDVGARLEQDAQGIEMPAARGEHERREAGRMRRVEHPAAARRPAARLGPRMDVGAQLRQRVDRGGVVPRRRPHQRGLAAEPVARVGVGAAHQQQADRVGVARPRRRHQHRLAFRKRRIRIGARVEQRLQDRGVAVLGGQRDRRHAVPVGRGHVGARLDQQVDEGRGVAVHGPVQRGGAVRLGLVHVDGRVVEERTNRFDVSRPHRRDQRRVTVAGRFRRRGRRRTGDQRGHPGQRHQECRRVRCWPRHVA